MHDLWLAWKHLVHRPATLVLNLALLALSTGLIAAVLLFNRMLTDRLDRNLAGIDMVIGAKGSPLQLILAGMYHIDVPTGNISLQSAAPFLRKGHPLIAQAVPLSMGDSYQGYRIVGTDTSFLALYELQLQEGAIFERPLDVVAGATAAKRLGLKVGDTFRSIHGLDDNPDLEHADSEPFRVSGILAPSGTVADQLLLCPTEGVWAVHGHHDHGSETVNAEHADHDHAGHDHAGHDHDDHDHGDHAHDEAPSGEAAAEEAPMAEDDREITSVLVRFKVRNHLTLNMPRNINENTDLQAASPAIELNRLYDMLGAGAALLRTLAWIILAVSGLSIFVSLYNAMKARRYELALMRVLGSTPGGLFRLVVLEGFLTALLGGLLGLLLAHGGIALAGQVLEQEWRHGFDPWVFLPEEGIVFAATLLFGMLAALIPALQARRVDIGSTLTEG